MKNYPVIQRDIEGLNQMQVGSRMSKLRSIVNKHIPAGYDTCNFTQEELMELLESLYMGDVRKNKANSVYENITYEYDSWKPFYYYCSEGNLQHFYGGFKQFIARGIYKKKKEILVYDHFDLDRAKQEIENDVREKQARSTDYKNRNENYEQYMQEKLDKQQSHYNEYLSSPLWKEKRKQVFEKDGSLCVMCGTKDGPREVHHRKYDKFKKEDEIEDLFLLCSCCHNRHHKNPDKQSYYKMLREALIEPTDHSS